MYCIIHTTDSTYTDTCSALTLQDFVTTLNPILMAWHWLHLKSKKAVTYSQQSSCAKAEAFPQLLFFLRKACCWQLAGTDSDIVRTVSLLNSTIRRRCLSESAILRDTDLKLSPQLGQVWRRDSIRWFLSYLAGSLKRNIRFQSCCTFTSYLWLGW